MQRCGSLGLLFFLLWLRLSADETYLFGKDLLLVALSFARAGSDVGEVLAVHAF